MIVADAVMRWLADAGHGTVGTDLYAEYLPESPDEAAMVVSTGGTDVSGQVQGWTDPTVQVLVRGTSDPRVSSGRAQDIADALQAMVGPVDDSLGGTGRVAGVELIQPHPVRVGQDDTGRHRHSINARVLLDR